MAIKRMCDQCGVELDGPAAKLGNHGSTESGESEGLVKEHGDIRVRLVAGRKGNAYFSGDWCKYCMLDAIAKLDDRPRPEDQTKTIDTMQRLIDDQASQIHRLQDVNGELTYQLCNKGKVSVGGAAGGPTHIDLGATGGQGTISRGAGGESST